MKSKPLNPNILLKSLICSLLPLLISPVSAGTISQTPLFITSSLDPNIMFIIDDSGSMNASYLPDSICDPTSLRTTHRVYSSTINGLAYNPAITYTPPLDQNGVSLGNSPFTAAWKNGYALPHPTSGTIAAGGTRVNLSSQYQPTWSSNGTGCGDSTEYNGTAQAAYYYKYTPGGPGCDNSNTTTKKISIDNDSCYSLITVGASEQQNFANWYSYYRTRIMTVKGAASRAFATLDNAIRVGWGRINNSTNSTIDGLSIDTVVNGVRPFTGTDRQHFFTWLFGLTAGGSTPTRRAMDSVGRYYSVQTTQGPWSSTPGTTGGALYACRQSFMVLMTDGYWNSTGASTTAATSNNDGTTTNNNVPSPITSPDGKTFTYAPVSPFKDNYSNTLADVAMYYWKRDLCPNIDNRVPTSQRDPAFWQHMVIYGIGLGVPLTGTYPVDPFTTLTTGTPTITWPDPQTGSGATSVPTRIDDLLHAAVDGHGGYLTAYDSGQFVQALNSTLNVITDTARSSASATATNSTSLHGDTLLYQATFKPLDWSGKLNAFPINATNGSIDTTTPNWEASAQLAALASYTNRNILTLNPTISRTDPTNPHGSLFQWTSLSPTQQSSLNTLVTTIDGNGEKRTNWLRGDSSFEQPPASSTPTTPDPTKIFRARSSLLGDIINSDPIFVGYDDYGYGTLNGYNSFRTSASFLSRTPTLYVGANDGMLHAFDARKDDPTTGVASGGHELFAYVPNILFEASKLSNLTAPNYLHQYYVDGPIGVGDAYIKGDWHTMLAGTTGAGGRGVFALDITNPANFAASNVLWEFTYHDDSDLGYTMAQPAIVRTNDPSNEWMVIVGNGYESDNGHAVLMLLNAQTGALINKIDTGSGSVAAKNGLSSPLVLDTNNDQKVDVAYAGDLYGNLWKFDLTGNATGWKVAFTPGGVKTPLFVACATTGPCTAANRQPITAKPNAGAVGTDQSGGLMIYFGTGKYFEVGDNVITGTPQTQTFYGLWDNGSQITDRANLQAQSIIFEGYATTTGGSTTTNKQRIVSTNPVCYSATSSTGCAAPFKRGWALDLLTGSTTVGAPLTAEGERVVSYPLVRRGLVVFSTIIPSSDPCQSGGRGWLMEVDAHTGATPVIPPFDINNDNAVNGADKVVINGVTYVTSGLDVAIGLHKTPSVVESVGVDYKFLSGSTGSIGQVKDAGVFPPATTLPTPMPISGARQAWRQLR